MERIYSRKSAYDFPRKWLSIQSASRKTIKRMNEPIHNFDEQLSRIDSVSLSISLGEWKGGSWNVSSSDASEFLSSRS